MLGDNNFIGAFNSFSGKFRMKTLFFRCSLAAKRRHMILITVLCVLASVLLSMKVIYERVLYPARLLSPWQCKPVERSQKTANVSHENNSTKLILFYNTWFGRKPWWGMDSNESFLAGCPSMKCRIAYDVDDIGQSDAVIFHLGYKGDTPRWEEIQQIHQYRCSYQRIAILTQESLLHPDIADISFIPKGFFNWTLTFKRTSDFPLPYGHFFPLQLPAASTSNDTNYAEGKDKLVAWAVSNCGPQPRGIYVKELLKHIQVDVYGKCGSVYGQNNKCSRGSQECVELFKTYKFYLSFENAACTDYVTEKFWNTLDWRVVPVVLAKDIYIPIAPPGSFISVQDFPSVKALALYLQYLDKNDTAYNQYFQWRRKFGSQRKHMPQFACHICKALHEEHLQPKVYHELDSFWNRTSDCESHERSLRKLIMESKKGRWGYSTRFFD